jgi:hypothetical protein
MGSIMLDAIEKLKKQTPGLTKIHKSKKRPEPPHGTETDHFDMTGEVTASVQKAELRLKIRMMKMHQQLSLFNHNLILKKI